MKDTIVVLGEPATAERQCQPLQPDLGNASEGKYRLPGPSYRT